MDALAARDRYNSAHQAELDSTNPNRVGGLKQSWDFATDYGRVLPRQQDYEANRRTMSNGVYQALDGPIDQMGQWMDVSGFAASMANAGVDLKDIKAFHHQLGTFGLSLMGAGTGEVSQAANIFLTANQRARNVAVLSDRYATREQKNSALQDLVLDAISKFNQETQLTAKLKKKFYSKVRGSAGARLLPGASVIEDLSPGASSSTGALASRAEVHPDSTVEGYIDIFGKKKAGILGALEQERARGGAFKDNHLGYVAAREFVRSLPDPLLNEMELVFQHSIPALRGSRPRGLYEVSTDIARIAREYRGHDLFGTIVHEVGHHLENFLTREDFILLNQQFKRERSWDLMRKGASRYANVSEWWAEKVRERIHHELLTPKQIAQYDHPIEQLLVKSKEYVMAGLRSTYASLIRLGRKDHARELYDRLIKLERIYGGPESYGKKQLMRDSGFFGKGAGSVRK